MERNTLFSVSCCGSQFQFDAILWDRWAQVEQGWKGWRSMHWISKQMVFGVWCENVGRVRIAFELLKVGMQVEMFSGMVILLFITVMVVWSWDYCFWFKVSVSVFQFLEFSKTEKGVLKLSCVLCLSVYRKCIQKIFEYKITFSYTENYLHAEIQIFDVILWCTLQNIVAKNIRVN